MKLYTIHENKHYSNHLPGVYFGDRKSLTIQFYFFEQCWFPIKSPDEYAINKLAGWSYGNHHKNSIRVGWRPAAIEGYIDLFFYIYANDIRKDEYFATIEIGQYYHLTMTHNVEASSVEFALSTGVGVSKTIIYADIKPSKFGYFLFPYFGGKNKAPHEMHIELGFK